MSDKIHLTLTKEDARTLRDALGVFKAQGMFGLEGRIVNFEYQEMKVLFRRWIKIANAFDLQLWQKLEDARREERR